MNPLRLRRGSTDGCMYEEHEKMGCHVCVPTSWPQLVPRATVHVPGMNSLLLSWKKKAEVGCTPCRCYPKFIMLPQDTCQKQWKMRTRVITWQFIIICFIMFHLSYSFLFWSQKSCVRPDRRTMLATA